MHKDCELLEEHVKKSIEDALYNRSKLPTDAFITELYGMSSVPGRHLMNNLLFNTRWSYLEIGTYGGSMFISALYQNILKQHWVIDNWAETWHPSEIMPEPAKECFSKNCRQYLDIVPNFFEVDALNINPMDNPYNIKDIDLYFYDGDHTREAAYASIMNYYKSFSDTFILVVDDWNFYEQREGTQRAINELIQQDLTDCIKVYAEWTLPCYGNGGAPWWNGMYIMIGYRLYEGMVLDRRPTRLDTFGIE